MGTGWLGWTAEATLDTHLALIVEAYEGRVEMLGAIFGGGKGKGERRPAARRGEPEVRYVRGAKMLTMMNALTLIHAKKD